MRVSYQNRVAVGLAARLRARQWQRRAAVGPQAGRGASAGVGVAEVDVAEVDVAEVDVAEVDVAEMDVAGMDVAGMGVAGMGVACARSRKATAAGRPWAPAAVA